MAHSLALAYRTKKRAQKDGEACTEHGAKGCEMCHGGMMAEGGRVDDSLHGFWAGNPSGRPLPPAPKPKMHDDEDEEMDRYASGGDVVGNVLSSMFSGTSKKDSASDDDSDDDTADKPANVTGSYAKGGMVDRIMKARYPKEEAEEDATPEDSDDEGRLAGFDENEFDEQELDPPSTKKADYTGADSGDELDDKEEDEDRHDVVSRAMKSWKKRDRLPRPA